MGFSDQDGVGKLISCVCRGSAVVATEKAKRDGCYNGEKGSQTAEISRRGAKSGFLMLRVL